MMRVRYLAAVTWDSAARDRIVRGVATLTPFKLIFERGPLLLFASSPGLAIGADGILIGTVFSRSSADLGAEEPVGRELLQFGNHLLIDEYWGGYLAWRVSPDLERVSVVRAPLGDLPCYWWHSNDVTLLGSDIAAMVAAGMARPTLDASALARHISAEDLRLSQTCLSDVRELQGGERLDVGLDGVSREVLWSPWWFAMPHAQISDSRSSATCVRDAVRHAVACQASQFSSVLLKLSGGLDSSIVAACLAHSGTPFTCLNLVTEQPAGDERDYARIVATCLGAPLIERFRSLDHVDLTRSAASRLPRPTSRAFTQASAAPAREIAREMGTAAMFDGGGGDNVFCSLQSARPVADCLLRAEARSSLLGTACSIAELAEVNLFAVAVRSLLILLRRSTTYRLGRDTRFLSDAASREVPGAACHPWLDPPAEILPGKVAHVALAAAAQSVVEGPDVEDDISTYSPLISQPVVETCLRVPSWHWFGEGLNRYAARRAFAPDLPATTIGRRSKAGPDCFVADLYGANRDTIRDQLLGGVLDTLRLLDRDAIEAALADEAPVQGHDFLRIMHLADVEAWARAWI